MFLQMLEETAFQQLLHEAGNTQLAFPLRLPVRLISDHQHPQK